LQLFGADAGAELSRAGQERHHRLGANVQRADRCALSVEEEQLGRILSTHVRCGLLHLRAALDLRLRGPVRIGDRREDLQAIC